MKTTTIQKWGNSYAVRIPKDAIRRLQLVEGQSVTIVEGEAGNSLTIRPAAPSDQSLDDLIARITPKNRHDEFDWGSPVGKEIW